MKRLHWFVMYYKWIEKCQVKHCANTTSFSELASSSRNSKDLPLGPSRHQSKPSIRNQDDLHIVGLQVYNLAVFITTDFHQRLFTAQRLVPPGLTFTNSTFCAHSVYMFCVDLRTNSDYFPIQH